MASYRAFYSVVQYCPDRFRAEAVNVGLVLVCLDPHAVRVRMTSNHSRVRKLFTVARQELNNLKLATHGLQSRIENSLDEFRNVEDLAAFAATRANDLRLTEPRLAKIESIDYDFERLFSDLVEKRATVALSKMSPAEVLPPRLSEVFYRLSQQHKIWDPPPITVPILKRKFDVPFAFRNGVINLIKPHIFPATKYAETQAATLAVNGDLIRKNLINGEQHQLIVVSTQETAKQAKEINDHVEPLFKEYGVRLVRLKDAEAFASEVEMSAH
jgi:hypothetical protein